MITRVGLGCASCKSKCKGMFGLGDVCSDLYPGQGLVVSGSNCVSPTVIAETKLAQQIATYVQQAGASINTAIFNPTLTSEQKLEAVGIAPVTTVPVVQPATVTPVVPASSPSGITPQGTVTNTGTPVAVDTEVNPLSSFLSQKVFGVVPMWGLLTGLAVLALQGEK